MSECAATITPLRTLATFARAGACSATLMNVLDRAFGHPLEAEETAANPFAGGIVQHGYQCGQLWGAALAAGAQAYRLYGAGPRAEAAAVNASRRVVERFHNENGEINCFELTDVRATDLRGLLAYFVKGRVVSCLHMAVRFAPLAFSAINEALAETPAYEGPPCVSCASQMARSMGASEMHVVMAAGLAGGLGLSGGACGALGVAVWLSMLDDPDLRVGLSAEGTRVGDLIEAFLVGSGHRFECAEIVGREFDGVLDHADHVRGGGCSAVIDALEAACCGEAGAPSRGSLRAA